LDCKNQRCPYGHTSKPKKQKQITTRSYANAAAAATKPFPQNKPNPAQPQFNCPRQRQAIRYPPNCQNTQHGFLINPSNFMYAPPPPFAPPPFNFSSQNPQKVFIFNF
jgi:hypothetical protein